MSQELAHGDLLLSLEGAVARLTLNRPSKRNALTNAMFEGLSEALDIIDQIDDVRVLVVRGQGVSFSAGADLNEWSAAGMNQASAMSLRGQAVLRRLADQRVVSIAVVHGAALGGGLELAMACDLRVASSDGVLGFPETRLGNLPGWGGVGRVASVAGVGVARLLLLTGRSVDGRRAAELGLVHVAVDRELLDDAVDELVRDILEADPTAQALAKGVLRGFDSEVAGESVLAGLTAMSPRARELKRDFLTSRQRRSD